MDTLTLQALLPFAALLASVVAIWLPFRFAWPALFAVAVIVGYVVGVLSGPAIIPIAVLAAAGWFYCAQKQATAVFTAKRVLAAIVVFVVALLLGFHIFPGFNNPIYVKDLLVSPGAKPLTSRLTFDIWAAGVLVLGFCYEGTIRTGRELVDALKRAWPVIVINVAVLVPMALILGFVRPDPKWISFFWTWAVVQLFFVIMTEEAFFRGFVQRELSAYLGKVKWGLWMAIGITSVLFGISHFAAGMAYVLLATVAGVGYGIAFQRSGRIEMSMLAHFAVNTTRFLFFTYPFLAR